MLREPFVAPAASYARERRSTVMRLVTVRMWDLTDQELEDLAAHYDATEPDHAAALRHLKAWRQNHPDPPVTDQPSRRYQVLRGRFLA